MKECLDEGRLQAFFDGELPAEMMEETSRHIASCVPCAGAAREAESENAVFLQALEPELSDGVPTEQLRVRITDAIAELNLSQWQSVNKPSGRRAWFLYVSEFFRFTPQRATAFASILVVMVLASVFAAVKLRTPPEAPQLSHNGRANVRPSVIEPPKSASAPEKNPVRQHTAKSSSRPNRPRAFDSPATEDRLAGIKLIPGEESYLRTIAGLDVRLKGDQTSMSPATRAEYERNLKLVDYAIAATRSKAKRSPHDPDAAEFMFAAYQSKIDLLSTMNETARLNAH
jgi:hypothetical protein